MRYSVGVIKPDTKRADIIERLTAYVLAQGLSASSLRPLAKAAGTSDRMLLYYFKDKAEIITAVLEQISAQLVEMVSAHTAAEPLPAELAAEHVVERRPRSLEADRRRVGDVVTDHADRVAVGLEAADADVEAVRDAHGPRQR